MTSERAPRVCGTCRARKKACDKHLPSCGYCKRKGFQCDYTIPTQPGTGDLKVPPSYSYIGSSNPPPILPSSFGIVSDHKLIFSVNRSADDQAWSDDARIHQQVCNILGMTGLSVTEISERYFRDFHRWMPIVSPGAFQLVVATLDRSSPPRADFSVLLLAMCLLVFKPAATADEKNGRRIDARAVYVFLKMLFAEVQATLVTSVRLIQTGLLISSYELACWRRDAAWVSVGTCARMVTANKSFLFKSEQTKNTQITFSSEEARNVWWGAFILERIVVCEIDTHAAHGLLKRPTDDPQLPSSLGAAPDLHAKALNAMSQTPPGKLSSFGRQAQAMLLLDQLLQLIVLPSGEPNKLEQLAKLDEEMRAFLSRMLDEGGWVRGLLCGAIGTTVRSLFILHHAILEDIRSSPPTDSAQWERTSLAALDTAAAIMVDVAHDHLEHMPHADALPVCGAYHMQLAREHLEARSLKSGEVDTSRGIKALAALQNRLHERWSDR